MADKKEAESTEEESTEAKPKKNMLMIIIIAVLVLIIIGVVVTAVLLVGGEEEVSNQAQSAPQMQERSNNQRSSSRSRGGNNNADSRKLSEIGILYPLDTFTVNLKSDQGRRYLKATISLELNGEELSIELDNKSPVIRDRIIRILSSKTLEEVSSKKGKQKVSDQIIDTMNSMIVDGTVKGIYFTDFVIQ